MAVQKKSDPRHSCQGGGLPRGYPSKLKEFDCQSCPRFLSVEKREAGNLSFVGQFETGDPAGDDYLITSRTGKSAATAREEERSAR